MIEIREALDSEMPVVRELFIEYAAWLGEDLGLQSFDTELESLPGRYRRPAGCILLAVEGDSYAGCIAVKPLSAEICEMKRLFVRSEFRGASLGRRLAESLIAEAKALEYRLMVLDTLERMHAARSLYEALGFREIEPYYENPLPGVHYLALEL